jgi:hypothetical protein
VSGVSSPYSSQHTTSGKRCACRTGECVGDIVRTGRKSSKN